MKLPRSCLFVFAAILPGVTILAAPSGQLVSWGAVGISYAPLGTKFVRIAAGADHNLAITTKGSVVAWGGNYDGEALVPVILTNVTSVAGGIFHSLALQQNGKVIAWGASSAGQTAVPPTLSNVVAIATGGDQITGPGRQQCQPG